MTERQSLLGARRTALLSGSALLCALLSAPVLAAVPTPAPNAAKPAAVDDGLGDDGFYLEADVVIRDDANKTIAAQGDVEARYQGRTIRAQQLVYDTKTGIITAKGKAQVISADAGVQSAEEITLEDQLRAGVASGFSTRFF